VVKIPIKTGTIDKGYGVIIDKIGSGNYLTHFILKSDDGENYYVLIPDRLNLDCSRVAVRGEVKTAREMRGLTATAIVSRSIEMFKAVAKKPYPKCDGTEQSIPDISYIDAESIRDCDRQIIYSVVK